MNIEGNSNTTEGRTTSATEAESIWFTGARCEGSGKVFFIVSYVEKNMAAVDRL